MFFFDLACLWLALEWAYSYASPLPIEILFLKSQNFRDTAAQNVSENHCDPNPSRASS